MSDGEQLYILALAERMVSSSEPLRDNILKEDPGEDDVKMLDTFPDQLLCLKLCLSLLLWLGGD